MRDVIPTNAKLGKEVPINASDLPAISDSDKLLLLQDAGLTDASGTFYFLSHTLFRQHYICS
jgi:hypothetical protein